MNNNEARRKFKNFILEWGLKADGVRNVFHDSGKLWAYVADDSAKELRQFYEDCSGIYFKGSFYDSTQLTIGAVTRVSPNGLKAYNAKFSF